MERYRWTYMLALQRAIELSGSERQLAQRLNISLSCLRSYLNGTVDVPTEVFLKVVDLLYPLESTGADPAKHAERPSWQIAESSSRGHPVGPSVSHPLFAPDFLPKDRHELLDAALEAAMSIAGAECGNIQLLDDSGALRIQVQHGFYRPFLKFFDRVSEPNCACGAALQKSQQIFVEDVMSDPIFVDQESGRVILEAGVRTITSSPIVNETGSVIGMVSTLHRAPKKADAVDLMTQQRIARRVAQHLLGAQKLK